ncbi:gene transfer agent family protein [Neorhizobium galegae]|uniref:gene transfer agent family protein n=1 Tax=Neorhizobium galegae TaxID=399 RepID=UPI002102D1B2|nr:gene transfer agent family protein [Neorhizobium galegae]MCQ1779162.1 gene transfer agent family protein [Neorhizobium galegae]MCQ1799459.1 gene transfer agent family protein [Neorhizobium galegae]
MIEHRTFFGDGEKLFAFPTRELIEELERNSGHGVGALFRRFRTADYSLSDVFEVIRLGLIGGGTAPAEADQLVKLYGVGRPLAEIFAVADGVITALFFGNEEAQGDIGQAAAINAALEQVAA